MKATVLLSLAAVPALLLASTGAHALDIHCAEKIDTLEASLADARAEADPERIGGLEEALRRSRAECEGQDLRAQREERLAQLQAEVAEDRQELHEAEREGDVDDILDARRDLAEAKWEMEEARRALAP
ncbi:DUF1090 family protein [Geminicoccus roseus]|uniref:DUF1090 family protein n=1 Tax=Geminicoccus roseus TaxID=404900 RepID=UPI000406D8C0|nr:DUF1090 family protein [Geminicoccus roseus]